jgi:hypothetical protein
MEQSDARKLFGVRELFVCAKTRLCENARENLTHLSARKLLALPQSRKLSTEGT